MTCTAAAACAEVVLFTAGVEDYAVPIADRLQEQYNCFAGRLYRPATVSCPLYPCIKVCARYLQHCPSQPRWPPLCSWVSGNQEHSCCCADQGP